LPSFNQQRQPKGKHSLSLGVKKRSEKSQRESMNSPGDSQTDLKSGVGEFNSPQLGERGKRVPQPGSFQKSSSHPPKESKPNPLRVSDLIEPCNSVPVSLEADVIPSSPNLNQHQRFYKRKHRSSTVKKVSGRSQGDAEHSPNSSHGTKLGLFPTLKESVLTRLKDEDFSLPREYRGLKLEVQRSQNVIAPFYSPAKTSQEEFICSPSLLQTSRRRRKRGQKSPSPEKPPAKRPLFEDALLDDFTSELFTSWGDSDPQNESEQATCDQVNVNNNPEIHTLTQPTAEKLEPTENTQQCDISTTIEDLETKKEALPIVDNVEDNSKASKENHDVLTNFERTKSGYFSSSDSLKSVADFLDITESLVDEKCDNSITASDMVRVLASKDDHIFPLECHENLFVVASREGVSVQKNEKVLKNLNEKWSEKVLVFSDTTGLQVLTFEIIQGTNCDRLCVEFHVCTIDIGGAVTDHRSGSLKLYQSKQSLTNLRVAGNRKHLVAVYWEGNEAKLQCFEILVLAPFSVKRRMAKVLPLGKHPRLSVQHILQTDTFLVSSGDLQSILVGCWEEKIYQLKQFDVPLDHLSATEEGLIVLSSDSYIVRKFRLGYSSSDLQEVTQYKFDCDFKRLIVCGERFYIKKCEGLYVLNSSKLV